MFIPAMILTRPISAGWRCFGGGGCSTRTPSTRHLTLSSFSNGSMCTSEARDWMASSSSRLTRLINVGCSAMRWMSSASMASRLCSMSASPLSPASPARLSAMRAAVVP
jgi:hypothetical protein